MNQFVKLVIVMIMLSVSGCGDSSKDKSIQVARIEGVVTERDTAVTQGKIIAKDSTGASIASTELKGGSNYSITIPGNASYPITLEIAVDDTLLEAVVMNPSSVRQDISTMSTLIVQSARNLGGISKENMAQAAINAIRQNKKASGKGTSTGFKGDPTKQYGGWH